MEAAQSVAQGRCGNALKNIYLKKKMKRLLYLLLIPVLMFVPAHAQENIEDGDVYVSDDADTICVDSLPDEWQSLPWPQSVQESLTSLLDAPLFRTSQVGIMVYDLDADSAIFRHNERQRLRPASTMKLVTAIAAIDKLGGGYQFKTELCYTGSVTDGVLRGDVYCVGGFDPRFNSDDLRAFVESIHKMGVDTIRGNLYADKTMKDSTRFGKGWCWDDDNPVLSPLLISRKDSFMTRFAEELREVGIVVEGGRGYEAGRRLLHLPTVPHDGPDTHEHDEGERQPLRGVYVLPARGDHRQPSGYGTQRAHGDRQTHREGGA